MPLLKYRSLPRGLFFLPHAVDTVFEADTPISYQDVLSEHSYSARLPTLTPYVENVCTYIAGFVVRRLLPRLKCTECRELLVGVADAPNCCFLRLKNNGGLITPSQCVISVVQLAEKNVRALIPVDNAVHVFARLGERLEHTVMQDVHFSELFSHTDHMVNSAEGIDNHVCSLVRQIVRFYIDIRKFHLVKSWNINQRGVTVRQSMTKLVLFKNQ
jgi:hypothetical protein